MNLLPLALAALVTVMIGPLPSAPGDTITARLCNGDTVTIPVGDERPAPERDCHPKACHAGTCREKDTAKQPKRPT